MTHRGPFQPLLFCDSVKAASSVGLCLLCKSWGKTSMGLEKSCLKPWKGVSEGVRLLGGQEASRAGGEHQAWYLCFGSLQRDPHRPPLVAVWPTSVCCRRGMRKMRSLGSSEMLCQGPWGAQGSGLGCSSPGDARAEAPGEQHAP